MVLSPETVAFIKELEAFSNRRLIYRDEVGQLVELARSTNRPQILEDAVFLSKFITKAADVMKRIGPAGDGYDKMAREFSDSVEKANALIKTLVKDSADEVKNHFKRKFFGLDQVGLTEFLNLIRDLAWIKNWMVDGKAVPWGKQ